MSAAELGVWVGIIATLAAGGWRVLRALLRVVQALESITQLSKTVQDWTEGMREWQSDTEARIVRLETLQMVGEHR